MADDVVWPPTGKTFATDDQAGVHLQRNLAQLEDASGNLISVAADGDDYSLHVVPGHHNIHIVHLDIANVAADQGFMLVDLSDSSAWPHTNTGHIDLFWMDVLINPDATFAGSIAFGFLADVDATDGNLHHITEIPLEKKSEVENQQFTYGGGFGHVECQAADVFGDVDSNDVTWQTDVNLYGPDGQTIYPSGDGDLVMKIVRSAGQVNVSVTLGYRTES